MTASDGDRELVDAASRRLEVVDGLLWAVEHVGRLVEVATSMADRGDGLAALRAEGLTDVQANHVLDMTIGRLSQLGVSALRTERAELERAISEAGGA